jgi:hypothetical protein
VRVVGSSGWADTFPGAVDELALFGRDLKAAEVRRLAGRKEGEVLPPRPEAAGPGTPPASDFPGLLGYWPCDDPAGGKLADLSGGGNDAVVVGAGITVEGVRFRAVAWEGAIGYVDYGSSPRFNFPAGAPFTVSGWVRTAARDGTILSQRNSKDPSALVEIRVEGGKLKAGLHADGHPERPAVWLTGGPVADLKWHHIALTRDAAGRSGLFLDGVEQGGGPGADAAGPITTDLRTVGAVRTEAKAAPRAPLNGAVDELAIFGRALRPEEIRRLATPPAPPPPRAPANNH